MNMELLNRRWDLGGFPSVNRRITRSDQCRLAALIAVEDVSQAEEILLLSPVELHALMVEFKIQNAVVLHRAFVLASAPKGRRWCSGCGEYEREKGFCGCRE